MLTIACLMCAAIYLAAGVAYASKVEHEAHDPNENYSEVSWVLLWHTVIWWWLYVRARDREVGAQVINFRIAPVESAEPYRTSKAA